MVDWTDKSSKKLVSPHDKEVEKLTDMLDELLPNSRCILLVCTPREGAEEVDGKMPSILELVSNIDDLEAKMDMLSHVVLMLSKERAKIEEEEKAALGEQKKRMN